MSRVVFWFVPLLAACASAPPADATLENDGAWVKTYAVDRDGAFHAAMRALTDAGYTIDVANPLAGTFHATSEPQPFLGTQVQYRRAYVVVEAAATGDGVRLRILLVDTRQPKGGTRRPNNDRNVSDGAPYTALFEAVEKELAAS